MCMVFAGYTANAQFYAGVGGGLPVGDANTFGTFGIAVDLGYLFDITEIISVGPVTGLSHTFTETYNYGNGVEYDPDDATFVIVGGGGRFYFADFYAGADLGYAVGVVDGYDGGFYFSPRFAYKPLDFMAIVAAYRGVFQSAGNIDGVPVSTGNWSLFTVGVEFGID